jgi:type II secretory pathway component GspD/PulD (secretin)
MATLFGGLVSTIRAPVLAAAIVALFMAGSVLGQSTVLEVIPLRYRTADQVIPIIQPMLAHEGSVSGFQGQLIVRTTPANLEEIKRILASLDTAPRRLLITVRQDAGATSRERAAEVSGRVGSDQARVIVPESGDRRGGNVVLRDGDDRLRARAFDGQGSESDRNTQSVQVLEGREAFVRIGRSVPVRERQVTRSVVGGQVVEQVVDSTQYRDVATGFYVLPRVSGDRVTLDVSPQRETLSTQPPGGVNVQRVSTTVSGRLGEWLEIGGLTQDASGQQSVPLGRSATRASHSSRVLVKVEELP